MTFIDSTSNPQTLIAGVEEYLSLGPNGELSVPSAHPNPSGGMFLQLSFALDYLEGNFGPYIPRITPVLIDYDSLKKTHVIVRRFEVLPLFRNEYFYGNGAAQSSLYSSFTNVVPSPPRSNHSYRIRFLVLPYSGWRGSTIQTNIRGLTQL